MTVLVERLERIDRVRVLNPWTLPEQAAAAAKISTATQHPDVGVRRALLQEAGDAIASANERALRSADLLVAGLDGVDVDSGTAAEVGYAAALGKPVFGLRTDLRQSGELEGLTVNLQVEWWIRTSGGAIFRSLPDLSTALRAWIAAHDEKLLQQTEP
jgi:hypothetical protein